MRWGLVNGLPRSTHLSPYFWSLHDEAAAIMGHVLCCVGKGDRDLAGLSINPLAYCVLRGFCCLSFSPLRLGQRLTSLGAVVVSRVGFVCVSKLLRMILFC